MGEKTRNKTQPVHPESRTDAFDGLARDGLRLTRQRQVVLDALRSCPEHPDAQTIYERARQRMPHISLGTVYRTLGLLRDKGLIQELHFGKPHSRYEERGRPHHHIVCTRCGRVDDLSSEAFDLVAKARDLSDFEIEEQRLEFYGRCPQCRARP